MTSSPGKGWWRHDTANARGRWRRGVWWAGIGALALLVALAFVGYGQPELLLDYANLRYCG